MSFFTRIHKSWDAWNEAHKGSTSGSEAHSPSPYDGVDYRTSGGNLAQAGHRAYIAGHSKKQVVDAANSAGLNEEQRDIMVGAHAASKAYKNGAGPDGYDYDMESAHDNARKFLGSAAKKSEELT